MPTSQFLLDISLGWWLAAVSLAVFAAYVALDLARGFLSSHRATAVRSLLGAALALSLGLSAGHLTLMAGEPLPWARTYGAGAAFLALLLGYCAALVVISLGVTRSAQPLRWGLAGVAFGLMTLAVPAALLYAAQSSLAWHGPVWALVAVTAAVLSVAAWLVFAQRKRSMSVQLVSPRQFGAALLLGMAITVGNWAVAMAARLGQAQPHASDGGLSGDALTVLATVGAPSLLAALLLSSVLEARFKLMLRHARDELQVAAETDALTQLPNRAMFERQLMRAAHLADRGGQRLAVLLVNLDGFQAINESLGQSSGDALLREMAQRLRRLTGAHDAVARAGGDEFLLLLGQNPASADAAHFANRVIKELHLPCQLEEREVAMSCSVGMAIYPEHGAVTKLVAHASAAMHEAKRNGGAGCCFFEPRMVEGARDQIDLLRDLRRAIAQNELELYYQPKIHAPSGQITGAEALASPAARHDWAQHFHSAGRALWPHQRAGQLAD